MNRRIAALALGLLLVAGVRPALAQRNFTRNQQAGLLGWQFMLQQQQMRQNQQFRQQLNGQFQQQQTQLSYEQMRMNALTRALSQPSGPGDRSASAQNFRAISAGGGRLAYGGSMHFNQAVYGRLQPYYDVTFIRTRGRPVQFLQR